MRELTVRAFILGGLLALILGAANAYLGLYAGMTVSASIPAAVLSMAILRVLGRATILENNVVQTIASAGEAVAAGAIFTFPAVVILGNPGPLSYWDVTLLCLAGGTMGSLLVVFLRRALIVDEALPFPEGRACADVLRAGANGAAGQGAGESASRGQNESRASAGALTLGALGAAALKASQDIFGVVPGAVAGARWIGDAAFAVSLNLSAALFGVGYIVGIEIAVLVALGGIIGWLVAIPLASLAHPELRDIAAAAAAQQLWSGQIRYLGVGAMLVGGAATLWRLRGPIVRGIASSRRVRARRAAVVPREETDLAPKTVMIAVALCVPAIFAIMYLLSGSLLLSVALALVLVLIACFATAVAGYLSGIVGASNNPVSGVTIIVLLLIAVILKGAGVAVEIGPRLAILAGAVVCTAAAMAGDSLHDLATGYHLRATPRALEVAVLAGVGLSAFVMAPVLNLLIGGYGIAGMPGAGAHALAAPQAFLMAKVAQGVFRGGLPWSTIGAGALLAIAFLMSDAALARSQSRWRTPVMPIAIGLYVPFGLGGAILAGAVTRELFGSHDGGHAGRGALLAAGMIAGEALTGVIGGALVTGGVRLPLF
jgi:putative OPT family oligopeptide transporter